MEKLKKDSIYFIVIFIFSSVVCFGQEEPPRIAMPKKENKILIDKVIEATNYKNYFRNYCINQIYLANEKEKFSEAKIDRILENINFDSFKFTIYNLFAKYSDSELNALIEKYKTNPEESKIQNLIVGSEMVQTNLKNYAKELIKNSQ